MAKEQNIETTAVTKIGNRGLEIRTTGDLLRIAKGMVEGGIAPKGMSPNAAMAVMAFGMEFGLSPIQSLRDIAFINGRPSAYGDAISGLLHASGQLADMPEEFFEGAEDNFQAVCILKRKGMPNPIKRSFSVGDAKRAGLWGKDNWKAYPQRMLRWRAFSWAARDGFADVLKGLWVREEAEDIPREMQDTEAIEIKEVKSSHIALPASAPWEKDEPTKEAPEFPPDGPALPEKPSAPELPPKPADDLNDKGELFKQWSELMPMLSEEELEQIRKEAEVDYITPRASIGKLWFVVQMGKRMLERKGDV